MHSEFQDFFRAPTTGIDGGSHRFLLPIQRRTNGLDEPVPWLRMPFCCVNGPLSDSGTKGETGTNESPALEISVSERVQDVGPTHVAALKGGTTRYVANGVVPTASA